MVNAMLCLNPNTFLHLHYDMMDGQVVDELRSFPKQEFQDAFTFGCYGNLSVHQALEVAQYAHLNAPTKPYLDPWQAGSQYVGTFRHPAEVAAAFGFEVCDALKPFVNWHDALQQLVPGIMTIKTRDGIEHLVFKPLSVS